MLVTTVQRILVVDDDRDIVRLLRAYLERASFDVLTAYDGEMALHVIRQQRPDLVILDLMLPSRDGWSITQTMRADEQLASIPIIMLTARIEQHDKIAGLELGADDYVTKPFNSHEVVARVRTILRRAQQYGKVFASTILHRGEITMDFAQHQVMIQDKLIELTPSEFNILRVLLENVGIVFTRTELSERGLGYDYEGLERTLDSHIKNLRKKIEPDPSAPTYIQTIYGVGYRLAV